MCIRDRSTLQTALEGLADDLMVELKLRMED